MYLHFKIELPMPQTQCLEKQMYLNNIDNIQENLYFTKNKK